MIKNNKLFLGILVIIGLSMGCQSNQQNESTNQSHEATNSEHETGTHEHSMTVINKAICVLYPTEGNMASGIVTFTKTSEGIRVEATVNGLTAGKHGFHIHQKGDCSATDGTSAGGHFNPFDKPHGGPDAMERHVGDLGNLDAGDDGQASLTYVDEHLSFSGENSIIGRGIIVHAGEDDLTSQPTGAAGARVACGVIGIVE